MPPLPRPAPPPPLPPPPSATPARWSLPALDRALARLCQRVRRAGQAPLPARLPAAHRSSARNFRQYLALRHEDLRPLQRALAAWGLSSLGRCEADVLPQLEAVARVVRRLRHGRGPLPATARDGDAALRRATEALFGPPPSSPGRQTRIMATLPSEAATDPSLIAELVAAGIDAVRINCAHDAPEAWMAMVRHLRAAEAGSAHGRRVRVLMDLGGPKVRLAPLPPDPGVVVAKPLRSARGAVLAPATWVLHPAAQAAPVLPLGATTLPVLGDLTRFARGDTLHTRDARGKRRTLTVVQALGQGWIATCPQTAYLAAHARLRGRAGSVRVAALPPLPHRVLVREGETLRLVAPGRRDRAPGAITLAISEPRVLTAVAVGHRLLIDDGSIPTVVTRRIPGGVECRVLKTRPRGSWLRGEQGINCPDTVLRLPALAPADIAALDTVVACADMVGLSFVQRPEDIRHLRRLLARQQRPELPIVLKIETPTAFRHLPALLLEALAGPTPGGVMIARGDLAVECGYERLAEVQEEILWICEAARIPAIWATQVLESLAKSGTPTRAEITDAAMGARAEGVMLNKGAHAAEAVRALDGILQRIEGHLHKKSARLRHLRSWDPPTARRGRAPTRLPVPAGD